MTATLATNVVFTGRWGNAMDKLKRYGKIAEKTKVELEDYLAEEALAIIVRHIDKQDLPWTKLAESYLITKLSQDLSSKMWVATGEFKSKLRVRRFQGIIHVGVSGDVGHRASGLSMQDVATILEFGAPEAGLPARPLFRPSMTEFRSWLKTQNKKWGSSIKAEFFG